MRFSAATGSAFRRRSTNRQGMFVVSHLDPEDRASGPAHHLSESVHRRHNIARRRHDGMADPIIHEGVLQVDYDERGASRVEIRKAMFAAAERMTRWTMSSAIVAPLSFIPTSAVCAAPRTVRFIRRSPDSGS